MNIYYLKAVLNERKFITMLTRRIPISVAEAQKKINEIPLKTATETIPLSEANHRVLAKDVHAHYDYPHFLFVM